ncbi:hypothetical protein L9F63_006231, partial [Diploptera punctata]
FIIRFITVDISNAHNITVETEKCKNYLLMPKLILKQYRRRVSFQSSSNYVTIKTVFITAMPQERVQGFRALCDNLYRGEDFEFRRVLIYVLLS